MRGIRGHGALALLAIGLCPCAARAREKADGPLVATWLEEGKLVEGERALQKHLAEHPRDDEARFGLGALQFLRSIERAGQTLYRYGRQSHLDELPILRLPVEKNPNPEPISYEAFRAVFDSLSQDLARAETTLSAIQDDDVKLRLRFGRIRLDLNADGKATENEALWSIYDRATPAPRLERKVAESFEICFDRADVIWLRGYCHLLQAMCDTVLAHDFRELFERTGHILFAKIEGPYDFMARARPMWDLGGGVDIIDGIAFVHLINFPVEEPARMRSALMHLEEVVRLSRQNWDAIVAETDDDAEWVPSPETDGRHSERARYTRDDRRLARGARRGRGDPAGQTSRAASAPR